MASPKERMFIKKYIDTYNPINPSKKLLIHLKTVNCPKSGYLNTETRGKKLIDLTIDKIDYLSNRCKQCPDDLKLMAKVMYYIKWYKEDIVSGDKEDLELYEEEFREDFKVYNIDFDTIFTKQDNTASSSIPDENSTNNLETKPNEDESISTESNTSNNTTADVQETPIVTRSPASSVNINESPLSKEVAFPSDSKKVVTKVAFPGTDEWNKQHNKE